MRKLFISRLLGCYHCSTLACCGVSAGLENVKDSDDGAMKN